LHQITSRRPYQDPAIYHRLAVSLRTVKKGPERGAVKGLEIEYGIADIKANVEKEEKA
jgi:hypothetical protein